MLVGYPELKSQGESYFWSFLKRGRENEKVLLKMADINKDRGLHFNRLATTDSTSCLHKEELKSCSSQRSSDPDLTETLN